MRVKWAASLKSRGIQMKASVEAGWVANLVVRYAQSGLTILWRRLRDGKIDRELFMRSPSSERGWTSDIDFYCGEDRGIRFQYEAEVLNLDSSIACNTNRVEVLMVPNTMCASEISEGAPIVNAPLPHF